MTLYSHIRNKCPFLMGQTDRNCKAVINFTVTCFHKSPLLMGRTKGTCEAVINFTVALFYKSPFSMGHTSPTVKLITFSKNSNYFFLRTLSTLQSVLFGPLKMGIYRENATVKLITASYVFFFIPKAMGIHTTLPCKVNCYVTAVWLSMKMGQETKRIFRASYPSFCRHSCTTFPRHIAQK